MHMLLTDQDLIDRLRKAVEIAGSQKNFAQQQGLSEQYVSDVLNRRREPGQKMLDALGLERIVGYREKAQ